MGELTLMQAIAQVGFPIAVATYTLVVLNKTVQQLNETVLRNTEIMKQVVEKLNMSCAPDEK